MRPHARERMTYQEEHFDQYAIYKYNTEFGSYAQRTEGAK